MAHRLHRIGSSEGLRFTPGNSSSADPDSRVLSDEDLERAKKEGEGSGSA